MTQEAKLSSSFTWTDLCSVPALTFPWDSIHLILSPPGLPGTTMASSVLFEHRWHQTVACQSMRGCALSGTMGWLSDGGKTGAREKLVARAGTGTL